MNLSDIETLFAYNRWANRRMFSVLEKLTDQQLSFTRQSSFPSIHESVLHIIAAEWIWLKRWKGSSPRATILDQGTAAMMHSALRNGGVEPEPLSTLSGLRNFADSVEDERREFLQSLNEDALCGRAKYTDMSGKSYSMPLAPLMQHVVNHGTYHRGQVTTLLRQIGAETISLDMVYFFYEEEENRSRHLAAAESA
jgi:uncharacterized damage-inducible protein DinB